MTKHLRLIMLSLLAMICLGGYSQSETVYTTLSFPDEDHANNHVSGYDKTWVAKRRNDTWSIENCNNNNWKNWDYIAMGWKNQATIASIATETKLGAAITKVVVYYKTAEKLEYLNTFKLIVASDKDFNNIVETIYGDKSFSATTPSTFTITNPKEERYFKLVYDLKETGGKKNGQNGIIKISSIAYYAKSATSKTPTTTTFGVGVDNNTFKVKDGETFEGPVANCTTEGATGRIEYESSDVEIAKVDATTGAITLGAKYGTATITAQFVATGNYANSEARYSIKHLEDFVFYESFDKCNGEGGIDGIDNSWSGTLSGEMLSDKATDNPGWTFVNGRERHQCASFGTPDEGGSVTSPNIQIDQKAQLKFKAACWNTKAEKSQITISVSNGTLTYNGKNSQSVTIDMVKAVWTDYSMIVSGTKSFTVKFAGSGKNNRFFLDEVMVIKVAPQEITLDENSDNIVAAAENVNVTLKRKLIADDNWNTLCVPFNLTPEQTTKAFGADVELRTLTHAEGTTLTFGKATEIEAGKPYLIRVKEVPTDYVYKFTGVKVIASGDNWTIQNVGNVNFIGLYAPRDVTELEMLIDGGVALFLGDNNKFFRAQSGTKMGGFRAFFLVSKDTNPTNVKAVIDGVANGIEDLVIDGVKANGRVYNLNGQYVGKSLNGLQPGLYIQNGKKIVIK